MTQEIITLILSALTATISAPLGAWLGSKMMRQRHRLEMQRLEEEMEHLRAERRTDELENVRKATEILMEGVVTPLKTELKQLRNEINRMRKAIERIPACPHSDDCPVRLELLAEAPLADHEPQRRKKTNA